MDSPPTTQLLDVYLGEHSRYERCSYTSKVAIYQHWEKSEDESNRLTLTLHGYYLVKVDDILKASHPVEIDRVFSCSLSYPINYWNSKDWGYEDALKDMVRLSSKEDKSV